MDDRKKLLEKQRKLMDQLHDVIGELDWVMGVPKQNTTTGLIVGSIQYVMEKCDVIYGVDNYEIIGQPRILEQALKEPVATSDNKGDFDLIEMNEEEFKKFLETGDLPANPRIVGGEKPPTVH